jgi:hypothetical protein
MTRIAQSALQYFLNRLSQHHRFRRSDSDTQPSSSKKIKIETNYPLEHPTGGIKYNFHGPIYQLDLLMLQLMHGKDYDAFYLGTEVEPTGKFDDLFFRMIQNNQVRYHFFQAKSKQHPEQEPITEKELSTLDNKQPFGLQKYFASARQIEQGFKNNDPLFRYHDQPLDFYTSAEYFFIYTNTDLTDDLKSNFNLLTLSGKTFYQLDEHSALAQRLWPILQAVSDFDQLPRKFAEAIVSESKLTLQDPLFKTYHAALVREKIIDLKTYPDKKFRLHPDFINAIHLSKEAVVFRNNFLDQLKTYLDKKVTGKNTALIATLKSQSDDQSRCKEIIFELSATFGLAKPDDPVINLPQAETNIDDQIKVFLKKLVFAVKQPSHDDLHQQIKTAMRTQLKNVQVNDYFDAIRNRMLDWMTETKGRFLTQKDTSEFLKYVKKNQHAVVTTYATIKYIKSIQQFGIETIQSADDPIAGQLTDFISGKNNILYFTAAQTPLLSRIKLLRLIENKPLGSYIFSNVENLVQIKSAVSKTFASRTDLLILECLENSDKKLFTLFKKLSISNTKKVIVLTKPEMAIEQFLQNTYPENYQKISDHPVSFHDLTEQAKENLLQRPILFEEKIMPLKTLTNDPNFIDHEILAQLLEASTPPAVGKAVLGLNDLDAAYHFVYSGITLDHLDPNDLYAISGISAEEFVHLPNRDRFIRLEKPYEEQEKQFKQLVHDHPRQMIHWIEKRNNQYVWRCYYDPDFYLKRIFTSKDKQTYSEQDLIHTDKKLILIVAEPGMGKTTTLTQFSNLFYTQDPTVWVITTLLKTCKTQIENYLATEITMNVALDFMSAIDLSIQNPVAKQLFKQRLVQDPGKLILLWDGFDEIPLPYQSKMLTLLRWLHQETMARMILTTRQHKQRLLEQAFSTQAILFEPVTRKQQSNYLEQFWRKRLKLKFNSEQLAQFSYQPYIEMLLAINIRQLGDQWMGIPLQMRLFAEGFEEDFEKFCMEENALSTLSTRFEQVNPLNLFQRFIQKKYEIYFKEKTNLLINLNSENKKILIAGYAQKHWYTAFKLLFPDQIELLNIKEPNTGEEWVAFKELVNGLGMFQYVDDQVDVIHRTFAEYFISDFLAHELDELAQRSKMYRTHILEFLIDNILTQDTNQVIRLFLNQHLLKDASLRQVCLHVKNQKIIVERLEKQIQDQAETALHRTADEHLTETVRFLLNSIQDQSFIKKLFLAQDPEGYIALHKVVMTLQDNQILLRTMLSYIHSLDDLKEILISKDGSVGGTLFQWASGAGVFDSSNNEQVIPILLERIAFDERKGFLAVPDNLSGHPYIKPLLPIVKR